MVPRRVAAAALALAACASPRQTPAPVAIAAAAAAPSAAPASSAAPAPDAALLDESLADTFAPAAGPAAGSRAEVAATTAGLLADVALALTVQDTATARRLVADAARLAPTDPAVRVEAVRLLGARWGQRGAWGWTRWAANRAIPTVTPVFVAVDAPAGGRGLAPERWAATGRVNVEGMPIGVMTGAAGGEVERTLLARAPGPPR